MKVASDASAQPDAKGEYEFCQKLLIENISILEKTEVYATGAIAAAFAFSISAQQPFVAYISATIPVYIAIIGYQRWQGIDSTIKTINDYLEVLGTALPHGAGQNTIVQSGALLFAVRVNGYGHC